MQLVLGIQSKVSLASKKRWRMLGILCVDMCISYLPWYTFVPIMSQSMAVYGVVSQDLNMLCILYSIVYVPGVFLCGKLLTVLGCRKCFVIAMSCLCIGCVLRRGPLWQQTKGTAAAISLSPFSVLLLGQALCAFGQTFLVNATSHLAAEWFPPDERPAAAMISNLMNFIGGSLSFVVPTWYVNPASGPDETRQEMASLLEAQCGLAALGLLLTMVFYRDSLASECMSLQRPAEPLFSEMARVLSCRDFWLVNFQFSIYLTVMNTFDAIEGSLLVSYGFNEALSSWTAILFGATSLVSTLLEAAFIKHPVHYGRALVGANCLLAVSCLSGLTSLGFQLPGGCFVIAVGLMGFSSPGWGCSLEMGSEVCYPAHEATVSSLLEAFGSVTSVMGIMLAQQLIDSGLAALVLSIMAGCSLLGATSMFCLSGHLWRQEAEDMLREAADGAYEDKLEVGGDEKELLPIDRPGFTSRACQRRARWATAESAGSVELQRPPSQDDHELPHES